MNFKKSLNTLENTKSDNKIIFQRLVHIQIFVCLFV